MLRVIEDFDRILILQEQFVKNLHKVLNETKSSIIGHQSGSSSEIVNFSSDLEIWTAFKALESRYWNSFGIGIPVENRGISIISEINFPIEGINRRIGGAFAEDDDSIVILHRGKIGGGLVGVGKNLFFENFKGELVNAKDGDIETRFALVADFNSDRFVEEMIDFIIDIDNIKKTKRK